jgi:hypothetical protein
MLNTFSRPRLKIAAGGLAVTALVVGASMPAQAAPRPFPHVTLAMARADLPPVKALPAVVVPEARVTSSSRDWTPCTGRLKLTVPANETIAQSYGDEDNAAGDDSGQSTRIQLGISIFASPAQAKAAMSGFAAADEACPRVLTDHERGGSLIFTTTLSGKDTAGGWTGYRTVMHVTGTGNEKSFSSRAFETYLTRGNVVAEILVHSSGNPGTGPKEDGWRKQATKLLLARIAG